MERPCYACSNLVKYTITVQTQWEPCKGVNTLSHEALNITTSEAAQVEKCGVSGN